MDDPNRTIAEFVTESELKAVCDMLSSIVEDSTASRHYKTNRWRSVQSALDKFRIILETEYGEVD